MSTELAVDPADTHTVVHNVEVINIGEKLIVPETMTLTDAITTLQARLKAMQEVIHLQETYDVFPWDGSKALSEVLKKRFGWVEIRGHAGFFGDKPPEFIQIQTGPHTVESIVWGKFIVPGTSIHLGCGVGWKESRMVFKIDAALKRLDEDYCKGILSDVRTYLKTGSIYRGKAVRLRFLDDNGSKLDMPEITFIDTDLIDPSQLIYSKHIEDQVNAYLFTPIERVNELEANGIRIKRAVILGGIYGTGKTMAAMVAARKAVDHGITFLYVARADELPLALAFTKQYMNPAAVTFCEDVDRVSSGERDVDMDDLLNMVDGLDTKKDRIIVILTTNRLEEIHPAMIRRATVIEVTPPDAEAVVRLLRKYAGDAISADADLSEVGKTLEGNTPSVIADTLEKAKLSQLMLNPEGTVVTELSSEALLVAARYMQRQITLSRDPVKKQEPSIDNLVARAVKYGSNGNAEEYRMVGAA